MRNVPQSPKDGNASAFGALATLAEAAVRAREGDEGARTWREGIEARAERERAAREHTQAHRMRPPGAPRARAVEADGFAYDAGTGEVVGLEPNQTAGIATGCCQATNQATRSREKAGSWRDRHLRRHADALRRTGARGPNIVELPYDAGRVARGILDAPSQAVPRLLRSIPEQLRAPLLRAARSTDRRRARRILAWFAFLVTASEASRKPGAWRTVAGLSREALAVAFPRNHERVEPVEARQRRIARHAITAASDAPMARDPFFHPNSLRNWSRPLVAAGLLDVRQPGGPLTAEGRDVHRGPSGWALAQYRLLLLAPVGDKPCRPSSGALSEENQIPTLLAPALALGGSTGPPAGE